MWITGDIWTYTNPSFQNISNITDGIMVKVSNTCDCYFSFTIEVWISLDSNKTTGPYPVMCTAEGTICLSIEGGRVVGRYGTAVVTSSISLTADTWYNIIFRHRIEGKILLFGFLS